MRAVILLESDQQDQEVVCVRDCLRVLGWETAFAGSQSHHVDSYGRTVGEYAGKHGIKFRAELTFHGLLVANWDAVVIPGGWGAEKLRMNGYVLSFVKAMHAQGKIVAAICHGPWVLCSADIFAPVEKFVNDKPRIKATCYRGMADDLRNAGAEYVDAPVVVDGNIVTSPHYDQVPDFCRAIHDTATKLAAAKRVG